MDCNTMALTEDGFICVDVQFSLLRVLQYDV